MEANGLMNAVDRGDFHVASPWDLVLLSEVWDFCLNPPGKAAI